MDSERILIQLRTEGYDVTNSYDDAKPGDQIWVQIIHADEHDVFFEGRRGLVLS